MVFPSTMPFPQNPQQFPNMVNKPISQPDKMNCIVEPVNGKGGIYLGGLESAQDAEYLRDNKIRAVISIVYGQEIKYPEHIIPFHMIISGDDQPTFKLSEEFEDTFKFIEQHRKYTSVLIHCFAGKSRSATILLAYLMRKESLSFQEALKFVRKSRPVVNPNIGFVEQLTAFERYLATQNLSSEKKIMDKENSFINANGNKSQPNLSKSISLNFSQFSRNKMLY